MKNSADLGGCYPPRPSASVDNTLLDQQNSSYPTQPHSIIAKYFIAFDGLAITSRPTRTRWVIIKTNRRCDLTWLRWQVNKGSMSDWMYNRRVLLSESKWSGIVGVDVAIFWVVGGMVVGVKGGHAPLVNSMLSIAISLLQTPIVASICI